MRGHSRSKASIKALVRQNPVIGDLRFEICKAYGKANHEIRDIGFETRRSYRARHLACRGRLRPCDGIRIGKCSSGPSRGTSSLDSGDRHPRK